MKVKVTDKDLFFNFTLFLHFSSSYSTEKSQISLVGLWCVSIPGKIAVFFLEMLSVNAIRAEVALAWLLNHLTSVIKCFTNISESSKCPAIYFFLNLKNW